MSLLIVENLIKHYVSERLSLRGGGRPTVKAVDGVTFAINEGQTLGLVGESGSGKSTTARLVLRLEDATGGRILFDGTEIQALRGAGLRRYRSQVQAVFQDPQGSLNPRMRVGNIIGEPMRAAGIFTRAEIRERVREMISVVGLSQSAYELYPHEFSGGQRQRIVIARSLTLHPRLIILDEPVSSLDVSIRAQILNLLMDLQEKFGLSYLLISHDLDVVAHMCANIAVMYLGRIVETGTSVSIKTAPRHPYTEALFSATLPAHPDGGRNRIKLTGEIPSPLDVPTGCRFHTRCPLAEEQCRSIEPSMTHSDGEHYAACLLR